MSRCVSAAICQSTIVPAKICERRMRKLLLNRSATVLLLAIVTLSLSSVAQESDSRMAGYQGIWFPLGQISEYGDKYSGGLGTYTAKHRPTAIFAPEAGEAGRTFFVYGGAKDGKRHLLNMIGYYDHSSDSLSRPVIAHDKGGIDDPHDNSSLSIDGDGHVWVFVSGRGRSRPGFIYRSTEPYSIDGFEQILEGEFAYPQPLWIEGSGFLHCFTKYTKGRELYWSTSADGRTWSPDRKLAGMGGHYQNVEEKDGVVYMSFNYHPGGNVDKRTNLYFLQSKDAGATWTTIEGTEISPPLADPKGTGLVRDYEREGRLVYLKDMQFDADGRPVILIVTSAAHVPGPSGDPRRWEVVRWNGAEWVFSEVTQSTHNYDMGQLWIEDDLWRILGPTEVGPQHWGTGGEVALWESRDSGVTWTKVRDVTTGSTHNHAYVRRPLHAHSNFYAFWADGNADTFSESNLYFTNRDGTKVEQMPRWFPAE